MDKTQKPYQEDRELMDLYYKDGDINWVGVLLERYFHLIFGVCMKYLKNEREAKDHTQQICLKVLHEFYYHRSKIHHFKSWLYQVTKNHCLMTLRKNKHQTLPLENVPEPEAEIPLTQTEVAGKEKQFKLLEEAVASLNEEQQSCIQLFYYHRKSYREIAEEKGYSLKQVKSFIQNGRRNIKVFMERKENESV